MFPIDIRVFSDQQTLAAEACRLIGAAAEQAIGRQRVFRVVLAGGSTPGCAYRMLAATRQHWAAWEIFWGDERCLPADHPQRNSCMASQAWLGRVAIPRRQIHPIATERGAAAAAAEYADLIDGKLPFDLVLLGLGEDGHTASLFPGAAPQDAMVIAVPDAPKPPPERVSLACAALRACRSQLVLISGARKAPALAAWRHGTDLPIARVARPDACVLVDETLRAAAGIALPRP